VDAGATAAVAGAAEESSISRISLLHLLLAIQAILITLSVSSKLHSLMHDFMKSSLESLSVVANHVRVVSYIKGFMLS